MLNVDRWAYYTAQKQKFPVEKIYTYDGPWVKLTPPQRRRIIKKARSRSDWSC